MRVYAASIMSVLMVGAALCGTVQAQSYARTETTGTYNELSGTGSPKAIWTDDSYDDGCRFVPLPWDFPYFDRTYKACWMNTNGRVQFYDYEPDDYDISDLTPTVTEGDVLETISVVACDITGHTTRTRDSAYTVHYLSDRVVLQWRDVAMYESDEYGTRRNFQCQIFPSGEIRLIMGPSSFVIVNDPADYVSGIVNFDGTEAYAGFGNTLVTQTTPPASGTTVSLVPSGYTQANGVVLGPRYAADYTPGVFYEGATDVVVGQFCLQANGTGGTVTDINIQHASPGPSSVTLKLYADAGTVGVLDGSDTLLGSMTMAAIATTFSSLTEVLDGTTPLRNYLLAVDLTSISESFETHFYMNLENSSDITTTGAAVWGGYFDGDGSPDNPRFLFLQGPFVEFNVSSATEQYLPIVAGGAEVAVASFEAKLRETNAATVELNSFDVDLSLSGLVIGDIALVTLYRDAGTVGVLDGSDVQVGSVANPSSTTVTFSSLAEAMTAAGQDYLVTIMVGTSFTTIGGSAATIALAVSGSGETMTPAAAFWQYCNFDTGSTFQVLPNAAMLMLRPTVATQFAPASFTGPDYNLPVPQGATDIPVVHFTLEASSGAQTVTGLDFSGDGTEVSAANLYLDNGTTPGRVDAGDTFVATASTLSATNVTFTGLTETITTTASRYLLVLDVSGTATTGAALQYTLDPTGVTSSLTTLGQTCLGTVTPVDMTTDGVDVTVNLVTSSASVYNNTRVLIATSQQTPRGAGGAPAWLVFRLLSAYGGASSGSLGLECYLEGAGPVGQLDSTDTLMTFSDGDLYPDNYTYWGDGDTGWVTTTRNFLVFLRVSPYACDFNGRFEVVFTGLYGGTEPAFASEPNYRLIGGTAVIGNKTSKGGGGGSSGGCSTSGGPGNNWLAWLGALGAMAVVTRLRRSRG